MRAAQDLYAENGVAATTPRQVLERSGIGQGSLYHHFPSKRDLARTAVQRTTHEQLDASRNVLTGDASPGERIRAYLQRDRDAVAGCRVGRLTSDPLVMSETSLRAPLEEYFAGLVELVGDVFEEDGLSAEDARDRAAVVVAVIQGGYVLARATGDPDRMRSAVCGLVSLLGGAGDERRGA